MYMFACVNYLLQRLLLLPELSGTAVTSTNSGTIKTTSSQCSTKDMSVLQPVNKEINMHGLLSNEEPMIRILVSGLTASWTNVHVFIPYFMY